MCKDNDKSAVADTADSHRLPRTFRPHHYRILEAPDFDNSLFSGSVEIDGTITEPTSEIVLHATNLAIHQAWVERADGTRLDALMTVARISRADPDTLEESEIEVDSAAQLDPETNRAVFRFNGILAPGEWKLVARFSGSMVQPILEGFYLSKWTDAEGKEHCVGTTQFESASARRAFPCFDEPDAKATFDITLVVAPHLSALSNSRIKHEHLVKGMKVVEFHTTACMSTYLVAFCIGEFESSEPVFGNGKELRVWATPGKNHLKSYALRCAAHAIDWYERTFGVPYFGGDKIDMIAIPDFSSGAMENTGLITYASTTLLVDETTATVSELKEVAEVVFHELAHQWFGNLATMVWWDGLPLNESNATILAYLVMDDFMPEWRTFDGFGLSRALAMDLDSLASTHPCWAPVGSPDEVDERFDEITYEKGGSLELQIQRYISDALFYKGMRIYLERFAHGNAEVTDLWDAIEEGARSGGLDVPVRRIMDAWFLKDGHPLVSVSASDKPGFIKLRQNRFAYLEVDEQLWPIPVHLRYATANGEVQKEKFLFSTREQEVFIDSGFRWVVVNAGGSGFYRVRYSDELLSRLTADIFETLAVIERFNLVNDSWDLVLAQRLSSRTYLELIRKLADEMDPTVWSVISDSLYSLHSLTDSEERQAFATMLGDLVRPVFDKLGWQAAKSDSAATLELRGSLARLLGTIGEDSEVQQRAAALFETWKADRSAVDPNIVPALISILAHTGGRARFDEFEALADEAPTDQEKLRFLTALGGFRSPELYERAIEKMFADVKSDEALSILGSFLQTEHACEAAWSAIRSRWQEIEKKFPPAAVGILVDACSSLDTEELAAQVRDFFADNKTSKFEAAVEQMLERLSINVRLRDKETANLKDFLTPATGSGASFRSVERV